MSTTFHLRDFSGGRDLRQGTFAGRLKNRFNDLLNYYVTKGKKIKRRPPCKTVLGSTGTNCQGLIPNAGQLYTIAKRGDAVVTTISSPTITVLRFDNPDYCTTWTLMDATVYQNKVVAYIRHDFPAAVVTSRLMLHVFDASTKKPTYVEDPYCPTNWGPSLPLHIYRAPIDPQVPGAFADYTPYLATAAGRLYASRPDANVAFSRVKNARVWNTRTPEDMANYGEWWYFIKPSDTGVHNFIVSENFADLALDRKWSAYVLEFMDSTGTWRQFIENTAAGAPSDGHYYPASIAGRFSGVAAEIQLQVRNDALSSGTAYRFRMIAGDPPYKIVSGLDVMVNTSEFFSGNGAAVTVNCDTIELPPEGGLFSPATLLVYVGGVLKATPADYAVTYSPTTRKAIVTFVAAPAVGVDNIVIIRDAIVTQLGAYSYEGVTTTLGYNQASPGMAAAKTYLINIQGFVDVTANPTLTPFPTSGQIRYGSRYYRKVVTNTPVPSVQSDVVYNYGADTGHESQFYLDKKAAYLSLGGFGEAGFLPTSSKCETGGLVRQMAGINNRLIVHYGGQTQLWSCNTDQTLDQFLDSSLVGTGNHTSGQDFAFYGQNGVLSARGIRLFKVSGANTDNVNDNNIGEPIEDFATSTLVAAKFWPWTGQLICALYDGSTTTFHVFDYSADEKISAWSRWTIVGMGQVAYDSLAPIDDKMYFTVGSALCYFDASATVFRDDADVGTAYLSEARWALLSMDHPGDGKDYVGMDLAATGDWSMAFNLLSFGVITEVAGPVNSGISQGQGLIDLAMSGQALGPIIRSTDETGSEIEELQITYNPTGRP